jgi:hypothetical protein
MSGNPKDHSANHNTPQGQRRKSAAYLIAVGVAIGAAVGVAIDQLAVGVGIGTALGAVATFVVRRMQNRPPGG